MKFKRVLFACRKEEWVSERRCQAEPHLAGCGSPGRGLSLQAALLTARCWVFAFIISLLLNYLKVPWNQVSPGVESICRM